MKNPLEWEGNNLQVCATAKPDETEREMIFEMFCVPCQAVKRFTVTATLGDLFVRKTKFIEFGSICMGCNRKTRVKVGWNKETSWTFFTKDKDGNIKSK